MSVTINASIDVPDLEAGLTFYGGAFDLAETARPFSIMAILDGGNLTLCVHAKPEGSESSPGSGARRSYRRHWTPVHLDFHVPVLLPLLERIRAAGGTIEAEFHHQGPAPRPSAPTRSATASASLRRRWSELHRLAADQVILADQPRAVGMGAQARSTTSIFRLPKHWRKAAFPSSPSLGAARLAALSPSLGSPLREGPPAPALRLFTAA